jgi:hypothetical protein
LDLPRRYLDCAVIDHAVKLAGESNLPIDTVRAVFVEGGKLYGTAGFHEKNHIQVCVKNSACIVGYFRVR